MKRPEKKRVVVVVLAAAAIVGAAATLVELAISRRAAVFAYTAAFAFVASTAAGALALVMIGHLTRASWFVPVRRIAEALASVVRVLPLLFVPLAVGARTLHARLPSEERWMSDAPWLARSAAVLAAWIVLEQVLRHASLASDAATPSGLARLAERQRAVSAVGLPILVVAGTVGAFDWLLALVPGFTSTVYGLYVLVGGFTAGVAAVAVAAWERQRVTDTTPDRTHALGRVLFVGVCLWAYLGFSQLIIVWIGDLPHEVTFYVERIVGPWEVFCWLLFFGHFVLPFLALLSRPLKRSGPALAAVGAWLVLVHALDVAWLVLPSSRAPASFLDAGPFVLLAVAGAAVALLTHHRALAVPARDPDLPRGMRYESP